MSATELADQMFDKLRLGLIAEREAAGFTIEQVCERSCFFVADLEDLESGKERWTASSAHAFLVAIGKL